MTCGFCGFRNGDGEVRCRRCGRKPDDNLGAERMIQPTDGALAAVADRAQSAAVEAHAPQRTAGRAVQRSLFAEPSKIIPIASYAPAPPPEKVKKPSKPASRPAARHEQAQGQLEFLPSMPAGPRKLGTTVEAVIYCDAPVATRIHRAVAAALDWGLVLIGYGVLLLGFFVAGGKADGFTGLLVLGAALPLLGLTYGAMWTLARIETCGMRWTHLRLLNFDGFPPEPRQRILRFAGSCLSFCTLGVGLLWALADEESLTWQDHMSGTFPTPWESESQVFRRR
jgi:uncharacterized RDD family membrane protein YckC